MKHLSELMPDQLPTLRTHPHLADACDAVVIEVLQDRDVRYSVVCSLDNCAAARAIRHGITGAVDARVARTVTYIEWEDGSVLKYKNPKPLSTSVTRFDRAAGLFPPGLYRAVPPNRSDGVGSVHKATGTGKPRPRAGERGTVVSLRGPRARKEETP